jgi:hypothetical protein
MSVLSQHRRHVEPQARRRSTICVFIGYPADHRGYRCYNLTIGRVITSRHVVFDEAVFPFRDAPLPPSIHRTRRDAGTVTITTSTFG